MNERNENQYPNLNQQPNPVPNPADDFMLNQTESEPKGVESFSSVSPTVPPINPTPAVSPTPALEPSLNSIPTPPVAEGSTLNQVPTPAPVAPVQPIPPAEPVGVEPTAQPEVPVLPVEPVEPKKDKKTRHKKEALEWDDEPKKKGSKLPLILMVLVILGLGGFIVYDKYLANYISTKDKTSENAEEKQVEETTTAETTFQQDIGLGVAYQKYEQVQALYLDAQCELGTDNTCAVTVIETKNYRKPLDQEIFTNLFTDNGRQQLLSAGTFVEQTGVIYKLDNETTVSPSYAGTILTLTANDGTKYEYLATSYYCENGYTETTVKEDCTTKEAKFVLVDNKVEEFTLAV